MPIPKWSLCENCSQPCHPEPVRPPQANGPERSEEPVLNEVKEAQDKLRSGQGLRLLGMTRNMSFHTNSIWEGRRSKNTLIIQGLTRKFALPPGITRV
jgi:hypothetical protein